MRDSMMNRDRRAASYDRAVAALNPRPVVGELMTVRGHVGTITRVYPAGTVDVALPSGQHYRVTGLAFR